MVDKSIRAVQHLAMSGVYIRLATPSGEALTLDKGVELQLTVHGSFDFGVVRSMQHSFLNELFDHASLHTHNHTLVHSHTHYLLYLLFDEIKGIQDLKICSDSDSLIHCLHDKSD